MQYTCKASETAHAAIHLAAADMPVLQVAGGLAATAAISDGSSEPLEVARAAGRQFTEFCQLPDVMNMLQQQQLQEPQDLGRLSQCVLVLHAYAVAVEACPQRMQACNSEAGAALARVVSWGQQSMLSDSGDSSSSSTSNSERVRPEAILHEMIWSTSVTLLLLLLKEQLGSTCCSTDALLDEAVHALDSSGGLVECAMAAEHTNTHCMYCQFCCC
jgi:hypothetical protein